MDRVNWQREEPDHKRKAAAFAWWHEPDDARVSRPDVCPVKASVFSRRQTCRGKSQAPRSWDSRVRRDGAGTNRTNARTGNKKEVGPGRLA